MSEGPRADDPAELLEDAPCGYISTEPDGTISIVNRTFEAITGLDREALIGQVRFQDLLPVADQLYHETHYRPLLLAHGAAREIAMSLNRSDGSRLPVLLSSTLVRDSNGQPRTIRTVVFPATDRRLYEQELLGAQRRDREIALQLQRSLLAGSLPEADGIELAVGYEPGVSSLEAGGDWYDTFWIEPGESLALVVGDVVGHGLESAITMGQLRSATRAFASTGLDPAGVLAALDRYAELHRLGAMTTIICAQIDLLRRRLTYACAAHPPPLLVIPGEAPQFLMGARSMSLASWDVLHRASATIELQPGSTVVLYTDGLVEHPSRPMDVGMGVLRDLVANRRDERPNELCKAILDELRSSDYHDDSCVIVARLAAG